MDGANITPGLWWVLGVIVATGPAYLAARRSRGAAREEGSLTREAIGELNGRIDQLGEGLRSDIAEVRDWQAAHMTEHAISAMRNPRQRVEFRREQD